MQEEIIAKGKLFELVHETQADGRVFEIARRAPGVRLIVLDSVNKKVLLSKEFRKELGAWDLRLPGGKVFDSLDEYEAFRQSGNDIMQAAEKKVREEAQQEAGLVVGKVEFVKKSTLGATVEWDLFVFVTSDWQEHENGRELEDGELIEGGEWLGFDELKKAILEGKMQEERIAFVLLKWITDYEKERNNEI